MQPRNLPDKIANKSAYKRALEAVKIQYNDFHSPEMVLATRLDLAYEIHQRCQRLAEFDKKWKREYQIYDNRVMNFISTVLGAKSEKEVDVMMAERMEKRAVNPEYIPGAHNVENPTKLPHPIKGDNPEESEQRRRARYNWRNVAQQALMTKRNQALTVNKESRNKDKIWDMKMLDPVARDEQRIIIENGVVLKRNANNLYDKFDTLKMSSHKKPGLAAFTVNMNGEISAFEHAGTVDGFVHSSMNKSHALLYGGEIKVHNGKILLIGDHSGHYRPGSENIYTLLKHLEKQGVNIADIAIETGQTYAGLQKLTIADRPDLYFHNLENVYRATDVLQYVEHQRVLKRQQDLKEKLPFTLLMDRLIEARPEISVKDVKSVTNIAPNNDQLAEAITHRKLYGKTKNYMLCRFANDNKINLCYYDDDKKFHNERFSHNDVAQLSRTIEALNKMSERKLNIKRHYAHEIVRILNENKIPAKFDDFFMTRLDAEEKIKDNPERVIIRSTSKGTNQFCMSYMENKVCHHMLIDFSVDKKFHDVTINEKSIKAISERFNHWQQAKPTPTLNREMFFTPRSPRGVTNEPQPDQQAPQKPRTPRVR